MGAFHALAMQTPFVIVSRFYASRPASYTPALAICIDYPYHYTGILSKSIPVSADENAH